MSGDLNNTEVVEVDFPAGTEVVLEVLPSPPYIPQDFFALVDGFTDSNGNIQNTPVTLFMDKDHTIRVLYTSYPAERDVLPGDFLHALLVTGNMDLNPGDRAVVRRMQRLGFTVTPVLGSEVTRELADTAQLALISSTSETISFDTSPLRYSGIPIICWNHAVYEDLYIIDSVYDDQPGTSTGDTLEVKWDFNGRYPLAESLDYAMEQVTTQPADLGWIDLNNISTAYMTAFTDMTTEKIAIYLAMRAPKRATIFLRDNTALYLNDRGWHLFDCLVSWAVPRINVQVSPLQSAVTRAANSFTLNLENPGLGCNWQLITSDFGWIIPAASSGRLDTGAAGFVELAIDWSQFSAGETKVKNNLHLVFDNPSFGNEVKRVLPSLVATNGDQPEPRPPGSFWFKPVGITVAPDAPFHVQIRLNTGEHKVLAYELSIFSDTNYITFYESDIVAGPSGFIAADSMDTPGHATISGFDTQGTGPGKDLHLLTIEARSTANLGTGRIALEVEILVDEETNTLGIPTGAETLIIVAESLRGDMDRDGEVTIIDALIVARVYVSTQEPAFDLSAGDVNRNGVLDIIDALLIAQYYVGLIAEFPNS